MSPGMIRVSRNRLRSLCKNELSIQYGKVLTNVIYGEKGVGVVARFADGTTAHGSVLIGTDGPSSVVRGHLVGAEKAKNMRSGLLNMVATVNYGDPEIAKLIRSADPVTSMAYHPDGMFAFISGK
jgi:2-polyprenyl-6-methoxyphenol hydroxylase-like FAD-dependent oxidoreductase